LAQILGVSVDYLVGMTDNDRPQTQQARQHDENTPPPQPKRQRPRKAAPQD
jgi:hypothetical protein